ncbi:hypothetical protein HU200_054821 [Digitaria exilis]|uniref:Bifunctional inhibitor/plant lipid transfer protein/seed storage helical domain-containing protein n=1 Tax=Digitaria exilis TaxID=1010633 RepID=A0A835AGU3_9POAL|nr:hypothetical protein HU200_054821 [Digitaria exilis]
MAPSSNNLLIALLVALAISLQPSAAFEIRIPPFPCIPGLPDIWFIPCYNATPAPPMKEITECWTPVMKMMPCAGFLTNASITEASSDCCKGFKSVPDGGAAICYCHIGNGDIAKLLPGTLNFTRLYSLPKVCHDIVGLEAYAHCDRAGVPPLTPPSPAPSSPAH